MSILNNYFVSEELMQQIISCETRFDLLKLKEKIRKEYPSLNEPQVGKWYDFHFTDRHCVFLYKGESKWSGFQNGEWGEYYYSRYFFTDGHQDINEANNGEVERALTAEAIKRGFVRGALIVDKSTPYSLTGGYYYNFGALKALVSNSMIGASSKMSVTIFKDGKWAEKTNVFQELE